MEYGFVENWIADIIIPRGEITTPYVLPNGETMHLVDSEVFNRTLSVLTEMWRMDGGSSRSEPKVFNSEISGMKMIMTKYWVSLDSLDSITGSTVKGSDCYSGCLRARQNGITLSVFSSTFETIYTKMKDGTYNRDQDQDGSTVIPEPEAVAEVQEDKAEPTQEELFLRLVKEDMAARRNSYSYISSAGKEVIGFASDYSFPHEKFLDLADTIGKNVIVLFDSAARSHLVKMGRKFPLREIEEHSIIINFFPGTVASFTKCDSGDTHKCFGKNVKDLYVISGSRDRSIIHIKDDSMLSQEEKDEKIAKLSSGESEYSRYDSIYKDSMTNILWGVKDRAVIYMMFPLNRNRTVGDICVDQLAIRLSGNMTKTELEELDKEFYKKIAEEDKKNYIKFVIDNATNVITKLEDSKKDADSKYEKAKADAEEFGKLSNKLRDQISAFDYEKYLGEQNERAVKAYEETINVPKVRSINITEQTINVYTDNLYCQDERSKKWHDIGTFHIKIGMESNRYDPDNTTRIINTKHLIEAYESKMNAPHVFSNGKMCPGNAANALTESYAKRNLHDLVYGLIIFLESANTSDGAGEYVNRWPEVDEDTALGRVKEPEEQPVDVVEEEFDEMLADNIPVHT